MTNIIYYLASFLIATFAFGFGAKKLFKKKKPMYLKILVCAAGCYALQQLSCIINLWCNVESSVSIGMIGIFGCNFFLLSADFGTVDRILDDGKGMGKARLIAVIAPVITAALTVYAFLSWKDKDMLCAVAWLLMLIPSVPASYYDLKHILLPMDPFRFLRAIKPCNVAALLFYVFTAVYVISSASSDGTVSGIFAVLMSLAALAFSVCAVKGEKKWEI